MRISYTLRVGVGPGINPQSGPSTSPGKPTQRRVNTVTIGPAPRRSQPQPKPSRRPSDPRRFQNPIQRAWSGIKAFFGFRGPTLPKQPKPETPQSDRGFGGLDPLEFKRPQDQATPGGEAPGVNLPYARRGGGTGAFGKLPQPLAGF